MEYAKLDNKFLIAEKKLQTFIAKLAMINTTNRTANAIRFKTLLQIVNIMGNKINVCNVKKAMY